MKKSLITIFALIAVYACALNISKPLFGIRINKSESLPYKVFISRPASEIKKGSYVLFKHPQSVLPLVKQVLGKEGDLISIDEEHICINGKRIGKILTHSRSGKPFSPTQETEVRKGCLFVYAPHEESFDSRYAEFGLIEEEHIQEVLWPIF